MRMSFVGAGKVGTALGLYLKKSGFDVVGYYSKSSDSAQKAARITETNAFKNIAELVVVSDLIWITVNDDAIEEIDEQLAAVEALTNQKLVAHTSGALTSGVLKNLKQKGCSLFSIHPLQTFKELEVALEALKSTVFTIEGDVNNLQIIKEIFQKTNNPYIVLKEKGKTLYHAGACVLSNYLVTLMDVGFNLLEQAGLKREEIYSAVEPLIMGTLHNIKTKDPKQALTGPIQRGDVKTLSKHLEAIKDQAPSEIEIYQFMGIKTIEMLEESRQTVKNQAKMLKILKGALQHEK